MVKKCLDGIFVFLLFCGCMGLLLLFVPRLFKIQPQIVLSGSMEPEIPVGSIAYISENVLPEDVRERDIIAYKLGKNMNVLHRVIRVDEEQRVFQTKGDANQNADLGKVEYAQYEGKELFSIPYMGYLVQIFQTKYFIIPVFAVLVLVTVLDCVWRNRERRQSE